MAIQTNSNPEPIDPNNADIHPDPILLQTWDELLGIDESNTTSPGVVPLSVGNDGRLVANAPGTPPVAVILPPSVLDVAGSGWVFSGAWTVTDLNTVAWGAGTLTTEAGDGYSIGAGNTGNMAAKTYIYFDVAVSETAFQTTTTAGNSVGAGKILIAIAENDTDEAKFMVLNDNQYNIDAANIVANSITANELATSITYAGSIIIDSAGLIRSGQTAYNTGTGWWIGNDGGTPKLSIGDSTGSHMTWNGTTLEIFGVASEVQEFTSSGTWTKPNRGSVAFVQCWGGGGSGGADSGTSGGGGGGGGYSERLVALSALGSTETVTIGDGGAAVAVENSGNVGGNTTFGSFVTGYGGGGGSHNQGGGGGGGGVTSVGTSVSNSPDGGGGGGIAGGTGAASGSDAVGGSSHFGGAGGAGRGSAGVSGKNGGESAYGGGGGGGCGGSGVSASGGSGGASWKGGGGGGATGGSGGASTFGGAGGAGGNGSNGTTGSVPGGGGGGALNGNSGAGGKGKCVVTVY